MSKQIEKVVQERYGSIAASNLSSENTGARAIAEAFGYSGADLASIPAEANMRFSTKSPGCPNREGGWQSAISHSNGTFLLKFRATCWLTWVALRVRF